MEFERKIKVEQLKQKRKDLIKKLGISVGAYKRHFPKLSKKDRNYLLAPDPEGNIQKHFRSAAQKKMSLKQQVLYLEELLKIREENKESLDKLEKDLKEKAERKKENSNEK